MDSTPIILLHGLGGITGSTFTILSLYPLKTYLEFKGYNNVHIVSYPSSKLTIDNSVEYVSNKILEITNKDQDIIIVGQSIGGVIGFNMHTKGWKVKLVISIGSPLNGARLISQIENLVESNLWEFLSRFIKKNIKSQGHIELQKKNSQEPPPHSYKTISLGWFNTSFDGFVYKDEAIINEKHNLHLNWADHRTVFLNPRLWYHVHNIIYKSNKTIML